ncbi:MAG TPA: CidA/LrgA family protein [Ruminococcaceae bacterium]|mgnify:CR=1 FL=1|nr:CidA/LrgA family protein [Oscillospiraceae bacterium]
MKILAQIGIIFGICAAGQVVSVVTHLPVPGNVWGMGILFFLLYFGILKKKQIRWISKFLIGNMAFFFIPSGVAIIAYFSTIKHVLVPYLLIILFTTIIVLSVTGVLSQAMMKVFSRGKKKTPAVNNSEAAAQKSVKDGASS